MKGLYQFICALCFLFALPAGATTHAISTDTKTDFALSAEHTSGAFDQANLLEANASQQNSLKFDVLDMSPISTPTPHPQNKTEKYAPVMAVPEAGSYWMLLFGLTALGLRFGRQNGEEDRLL